MPLDPVTDQPQWLILKTEGDAPAGLEPTLTDVISHLADKTTYKDSRHVTWAHETTHGINARIRNQPITLGPSVTTVKMGSLETAVAQNEFDAVLQHMLLYQLPRPAARVLAYGTDVARTAGLPAVMGEINGFYVLQGRAIQFMEPAIQLSHVADAVPTSLRGSSYKLYLQDQQKYWADQPLYVLDEWSAYLNGLQTALDANGGDGEPSDLMQVLEFMGYALCLLKVVQAIGSYSEDGWKRLRSFVCWQAERAVQLRRKAEGTRLDSPAASEYGNKLLAEKDLADFLQAECGWSWYMNVLHGQEWFGVF